MKRSDALVPLSHDHHSALEVALRLKRAESDDLAATVHRFEKFWRPGGQRHFEIEERVLVEALPSSDQQWQRAVDRMWSDHARIRGLAETLGADANLETARTLGHELSDHVRFEEREMFELIEDRLSPHDLTLLGNRIRAARAE